MLIPDVTQMKQAKEKTMFFLLGIPALISGIGAACASTAAKAAVGIADRCVAREVGKSFGQEGKGYENKA